MSIRKLWLCVPPAVLCLVDHAVTLWGQPDGYWRGSLYRDPYEIAPHGRWLLERHPLAFLGSGLAWIALYSGLILALPRRLATTASLAVVIGHAWGSGTWISRWGRPESSYGYWLCLTMFVVAAVLFEWCWEASNVWRLSKGRMGDSKLEI